MRVFGYTRNMFDGQAIRSWTRTCCVRGDEDIKRATRGGGDGVSCGVVIACK